MRNQAAIGRISGIRGGDMLRVNFARGETAGLDPAAASLYCLAFEVEPEPDVAPPGEGGPPVEWRFLTLANGDTGERLALGFTSMDAVVCFGKAGQEHPDLPPSREAVKVDIAAIRAARCRHDILVDPRVEDVEALLAGGSYVWDTDGLESLW